MKSYWLRCASSAMTTMLRRSESAGCRSPFSPGKNFWIVVNTTPPACTASLARRSARSSACTGGLAQQVGTASEGIEELVVEIVAVGQHDDGGVLHRRIANEAAGVERHRQALARSLRVPDDADAPITRRASRLPTGLVAAARLANQVDLPPQPGRAQRFLDCGLHRVELVVARHLLGKRSAAVVLEHDEVADKGE